MKTLALPPLLVELVILRCDDGLREPEIAYHLDISPHTVKANWDNVYRRTGLNGFQVCSAWGRGWIIVDELAYSRNRAPEKENYDG